MRTWHFQDEIQLSVHQDWNRELRVETRGMGETHLSVLEDRGMNSKDNAIEIKPFGRREFLRFSLFTYLVAGIPTGLVPTIDVPNAFARVGRNTRGIAPPTVGRIRGHRQRLSHEFGSR